jgi:hypothetical protein
MSEPGFLRRHAPAIVAAAVALAAGLAVCSRELGSMGGDNADYVLLAKAIRAGRGYVTTWGPGEPTPHTLYPPVLPLLLVPFVGAAPESFLACHVLLSFLGAGAVVLLARLFERRGLPPWAAAAAALAPALSIWWLRCEADILSEMPFLFFAAAALLILDPGEEQRLSTRRIAWGAACAGLAFYSRTAGLALVLPVAAALCVDRRTRGRTAWIAAGTLLAVCGGWFLYGQIAGSTHGYAEQLGDADPAAGGLLARAWAGLTRQYLPGTPSYLFPRTGWVWDAAGLLLWGLGLAAVAEGILRRRTLAVTEAFLLVYLVMQCAWPYRDTRFALPLAALLAPFALETIHRLAAPLAARGAPVTLAVAILLVIPNAGFLVDKVLPRAHRARPAGVPGAHEPAAFADSWAWSDEQYAAAGPSLAAYLHACDLIRENRIPELPDGPVLASNPRVASLLCDRPAIRPRFTPIRDGLASQIVSLEVSGFTIVLADNFAGEESEHLRAFTGLSPDRWCTAVHLPGNVSVLRVRR